LASQVLELGELRIAWQRVLVLAVTPVIFAALHWFARHTKPGKAMRAMAQNREACAVVGVDVERAALWTFALGAALAGTAAALVTPLYNLFPGMGALLTVKAFAPATVGGLAHVPSAILASFLIGITESLAAGYVSYVYKDAFAFVIMIAVLLWRPQGLFGRRLGI